MAGSIGSGARGVGGVSGGTGVGLTGPIVVSNWWNAFTPWSGMEGETPLLEGAFPLSPSWLNSRVVSMLTRRKWFFQHVRRTRSQL